MLVSGGVYILFISSFWDGKYASQQTCDDNKDQPSSMGIRDIPQHLLDHGMKLHFTWRIIPVSKWLIITLVSKSPTRTVLLPNGLFMAYTWGPLTRPGMILQAGLCLLLFCGAILQLKKFERWNLFEGTLFWIRLGWKKVAPDVPWPNSLEWKTNNQGEIPRSK